MVRKWRWGEPLDELRELVERGGVLAIPTESSYGLGVDPRSRSAVDNLFAVKGRPPGKPLPVVAGGFAQLDLLRADWRASRLGSLSGLWPASLTLLLPLDEPIAASAGERTLAVRIPDHHRLRSLLLELRTPLTATSANLSGKPPLVDPDEVGMMLEGSESIIIDDGRLPGGPPSTIVGWKDGAVSVLRQGRFPAAAIQDRLLRAEKERKP